MTRRLGWTRARAVGTRSPLRRIPMRGPPARSVTVGPWEIEPRPYDSGPTWQDHHAKRQDLPGEVPQGPLTSPPVTSATPHMRTTSAFVRRWSPRRRNWTGMSIGATGCSPTPRPPPSSRSVPRHTPEPRRSGVRDRPGPPRPSRRGRDAVVRPARLHPDHRAAQPLASPLPANHPGPHRPDALPSVGIRCDARPSVGIRWPAARLRRRAPSAGPSSAKVTNPGARHGRKHLESILGPSGHLAVRTVGGRMYVR